MGGKFVKYTFVTVGIYLGVAHATGAGKLITAGSNGAIGFVRALQGRSR